MLLFVISFLLGVSSVLIFSTIPSVKLIILLPIITLPIYLYWRNFFTKILLALSLGYFWAMLLAHMQMQHQLAKQLESKNLIITGVISSLPVQYSDHQSFLIKSATINHKQNSKTISLSWYHSNIQLRPGAVWQLKVRLKRPHGLMNPGGFDYEAWLFQNGINAVGYVVDSPQNYSINLCHTCQIANKMRANILKQIELIFNTQPLVGFLTALTLGFRNNITPQQWNILRLTGTNHLIAIAGLHIGILAGVCYFLISFCWRRLGRLPLLIATPKVAALASLVAAFFYSLLAGFSIQTQRALIMMAVFALAVIFNKKILAWHGYWLALLLVLIINPLSVISPSFWLSFVIVAAIIYSFSGHLKQTNFFIAMAKMQLIIMLGLMPLSLWFFHEVSLVAFFANMIAVPWFSFIIIPFCFLGVLVLLFSHLGGYYLLLFTLKNLQLLWLVLNWLSGWPHTSWQYYIAHEYLLLFLLVAIFLWLAPKGFPAKYLAVVFVLPFIFPRQQNLNQGQVKFTLLDVGQGLAAVVQTQQHLLLFDTGPKYGADSDAGQRVILPYLKAQALQQIDKLIISHGDSDHIGGAKTVINNFAVTQILTSVPQKFMGLHHTIVQSCYAGQHWRWDGVSFRILFPAIGQPYLDNNSSCVLLIQAQQQSILLTGDIEQIAETSLLQKYGSQLAANILVAPHHGSHTSSSWQFIKAVDPKYVLYATGYLNRFHFPNSHIQRRYQQLHSIQLNTANTGAITFVSGKTLIPELYRLKNKHIWTFTT